MNHKKTSSTRANATKRPSKKPKPAKLRIIGGHMRGRIVHYHGADFTRPMKDNVRENLFNILGRACKGAISFDLFSGTGALAFESVSRGATESVIVEQNRLAAKFIDQTARELEIEPKIKLVTGDAFRLAPQLLAPRDSDTPWIVFLSPPYALWHEQLDAMNQLVLQTLRNAPPGSVLICETDKAFDIARLPVADWDHRQYGNVRLSFAEPAMVCGMKL